jgi:hypothetical protein
MTHPNTLKALKSWQKGQSGNPNKIYSRLPAELLAIKSLSGKEVLKLVSKYARMTFSQLLAALGDKHTPVLELAIAEVFKMSLEKGDYTRLSFLLDRAIGKVKEIEPEDDEEVDAIEEVKNLSMAELLTLVKTNLPGDKHEEDITQGSSNSARTQSPVNPT